MQGLKGRLCSHNLPGSDAFSFLENNSIDWITIGTVIVDSGDDDPDHRPFDRLHYCFIKR